MVNNIPKSFENLDTYLLQHKACIILKSNQYFYYSSDGENYTDRELPYVRFLDKEELSFLINILGNDSISSTSINMLRLHDPNSANYIEKTAPVYEYLNRSYFLVSYDFTFSFPTTQTIEDAQLFYPTISFDIARKLKTYRKEKIIQDFYKKSLDGVCAVMPSFLKKYDFPTELVPLLTRKEKSFYLYFIVTRHFFEQPHVDQISFKIPSNYRGFLRGGHLRNLKYMAKILNVYTSQIHIQI